MVLPAALTLVKFGVITLVTPSTVMEKLRKLPKSCQASRLSVLNLMAVPEKAFSRRAKSERISALPIRTARAGLNNDSATVRPRSLISTKGCRVLLIKINRRSPSSHVTETAFAPNPRGAAPVEGLFRACSIRRATPLSTLPMAVTPVKSGWIKKLRSPMVTRKRLVLPRLRQFWSRIMAPWSAAPSFRTADS